MALLQMSGALKTNPGRYKDRAEQQIEGAGPLGDPPPEFLHCSDTLILVPLWKKIRDEAPLGLLTASDREYVATICIWGAESKRFGKNRLRASQLYAQGLKAIGMTPDGRAIRGIGGKAASTAERVNPLHAFQNRRTG